MMFACPTCGVGVEHTDLKKGMALALKHCKVKKVKPRQEQVQTDLVLPMSWHFDVAIESENDFLWQHWGVYDGIKRKWKSRVLDTMNIGPTRFWFSKWEITRYGAKELDHANLVGGGAKALIDCLKDLDIIEDDAPKHFKCDYFQEKSKVKQTRLRLISYAYTPEDIQGLHRTA